MIIVTGAAGFIGSNLVHALNASGRDDLVLVDDLTDGHKFANLAGARFADYLDRDEFRRALAAGTDFGTVEAILHQGACSETTEWNGRYMLENNFTVSKELFGWCRARAVPMVYASSAAVYGAGTDFREDAPDLRPLNVYGWSKLVFDRWVGRQDPGDARVVGFRYFNVYGPREAHKGRMASVVHHFDQQLRTSGEVRLFAGSHGVGDGEQRRDFIHVDDVVAANLWALEAPGAQGVYNVGTGASRTFNDLARAVIAARGGGRIAYIPMPADLVGAYQAFTEADVTRLRAAGFDAPFTALEDGVARTLAAL
ncbi:MAG: ADP-glyceromanno-heptose 6-epimerase [Rhizobiales bacterium]|nr:ADP-glyceromanno-heptose 6-epimerase [Hyphomicrobiales bacterium]